MAEDMSKYVHEYNGKFVVCDRRGGRYEGFQRPDVRKRTGCSMPYGSLNVVAGDTYSYRSRAAALRKASKLYGDGRYGD